jgi:hypothetical protein
MDNFGGDVGLFRRGFCLRRDARKRGEGKRDWLALGWQFLAAR